MAETSEPFGRFKQHGPLTLIEEGMRVYDYAGEEIGTVERVYMGAANKDADPGQAAATVSPASETDGGLIEDIAQAFLPQDTVPEALRQRLLRSGFIRIDGGLFSGDRYAAPDQIAGVTEDGVRLGVLRDDLPKA